VPDRPNVVLASNRGPVSFSATDDGFETKRGAGGLAGALDPVARRLGEDAVWLAATTSDDDRAALGAGEVERLRDQLGYRVRLLDIDADTYRRYYDVVSNRMLWFANHCLFDELGIEGFSDDEVEAWRSAYEPVNERFARASAELTTPRGLVLFQDYHLATAPGRLRALRSDQPIAHFTHSSFCVDGGLDRLPEAMAERIVEGMLGADLLGFHVHPWAEAFLWCCEKLGAAIDTAAMAVEHRGRRTWVRTYPIPIDPGDLRERAQGEAARQWAEQFRAEAGPDGVIVARADRTEPSKNIIRGFHAFGRLLDRRPDLAHRARFVACLYPSRQSMPEYRRYVDEIQSAVTDVNARHPDSIQLFMKDDFDRTLGALVVYDVLLVNSLMDGMNLVSKEGPVLNERWGALVLSSGAGSYEELGAYAVEIDDARDVDATAAALERAIDLPEHERRRRALRLRHLAEAQKPEDWIQAQIDDLTSIRDTARPR